MGLAEQNASPVTHTHHPRNWRPKQSQKHPLKTEIPCKYIAITAHEINFSKMWVCDLLAIQVLKYFSVWAREWINLKSIHDTTLYKQWRSRCSVCAKHHTVLMATTATHTHSEVPRKLWIYWRHDNNDTEWLKENVHNRIVQVRMFLIIHAS